jgi:hypothetical protein
MNVAGAVIAFIFLLLMAAVLYSRMAKLRSNRGTGDYNRLFDGLPIPMYIYDHLTFHFLDGRSPGTGEEKGMLIVESSIIGKLIS